jgi:hypothetical protein
MSADESCQDQIAHLEASVKWHEERWVRMNAELTRLRERNNDSNYHQKQKVEEISALKAIVTIHAAEITRLREQIVTERAEWQDTVRVAAEELNRLREEKC